MISVETHLQSPYEDDYPSRVIMRTFQKVEQLAQNLLVKAGMRFEPGMSPVLHWQLQIGF